MGENSPFLQFLHTIKEGVKNNGVGFNHQDLVFGPYWAWGGAGLAELQNVVLFLYKY